MSACKKCHIGGRVGGGLEITFCPLHAAAPALLEALEDLYACNVWYGQIDDGDRARLLKARAAICAAKGEQ